MVSISKLLNNGLILAGQSIYQSVATPQQASVEQYDILRYLGGKAPYIQHPGFGIPTDVPDQCTIEQVQLLSRHGERYPSKNVGKALEKINEKFKGYNGTFKGELSFLNNYTYFVEDKDNYEKETTPSNSEGPFSGADNALRHGTTFRSKYNEIYNPDKPLPVFAANYDRVALTAQYFARGFLGQDYDESNVEYVLIDEDGELGANSLTPRYGCKKFESDPHTDYVDGFSDQYLKDALTRFQKSNPNLDLDTDDVNSLFDWCAYELNVKGYSPFCNLFSNTEFIKNSYSLDLENYYSNGPGNNMTRTIGAPLIRASLALLKDNETEHKIFLSFSHDTDLEITLEALGLLGIADGEQLPNDHIPFPHTYVHSTIVPQGARIYTEKIKCDGEIYVRYVLNDAVYPLPTCSDGPGFSCKLTDFENYVNDRLDNLDYATQCGAEDIPNNVTFYWDYTEKNYTNISGDN